jgi:hypothetical protein
MNIVKRIIAPIQGRILYKQMCPGCLRQLSDATYREALTTDTEIAICECRRAYIYNRPQKKYRRALESELPRQINR